MTRFSRVYRGGNQRPRMRRRFAGHRSGWSGGGHDV